MKSFTIALVLAVAFAAHCYAAPAKAPVNNYYPLIAEVEDIRKDIPKSKNYVEKIDDDIVAQRQAALSGNRFRIARTVEQGAEDTKAGAYTVKSNPALYKLADKTAPDALEQLAKAILKGTKTAKDENDLLGAFIKLVAQALANP